jgi:hypothetical protein
MMAQPAMDPETPPALRWHLAYYDEAEIEAEASRAIADKDDQELAFYRQALRVIDALKTSGRYDEERSRLAQIVSIPEPPAEYFTEAVQARVRAYGNLMAGVRSPDPEQQARFQKLMGEIGLRDRIPADVPEALLHVLELARKRAGRKSAIVPWANEQGHMDEMRMAVAKGKSVIDAARQCAGDAAGRDERAKTLARMFRRKMALRGE